MQLARESKTFSSRLSSPSGTARAPPGVKTRQVEIACGDFLGECKDEVAEITDCHFSSLTNTGNESSTKRAATLRRSLNGTTGCLHRYVARLDKASKLGKMVSSLKRCSVCQTGVETLATGSLRRKYITSRDSYNLKVINDIVYNENTHIVSAFKEYLIYDDVNEFLRRFYLSSEVPQRVRKITEYYAKYSKVFPNYFQFQESKYMFKNIKRKQRCIDDQQRALADIQARDGGEQSDDRLFTTHCMEEIDRPDSILGRSQRPDVKDQTQMQSYMRSQESIKNCPRPAGLPETSRRVEDMNLQELVDRFILKDSISMINVSGIPAVDFPQAVETKAHFVVAKKEAVNRPRNLCINPKEAWAESKHKSAYPTRAASVAMSATARQAAGRLQYAELATEKPATTRSRSQNKCAATTSKRATIGGAVLNTAVATAKAATSRPRSSTGTSKTHSRNPTQEKHPTSIPRGKSVSHPVERPATTRASSTLTRGKTTSQTPRTSTASTSRKSTAPPSTTHSGRPSCFNRSRTQQVNPSATVRKTIDGFMTATATKKPATVSAPHSCNETRTGSKLRNLKGVAIDTDQASHKHVPVSGASTQRTRTPGHTRQYKSDYLNSLSRGQNVKPTQRGQNVQPSHVTGKKQAEEIRTPPELVAQLRGSYTVAHGTTRPALTAREENGRHATYALAMKTARTGQRNGTTSRTRTSKATACCI